MSSHETLIDRVATISPRRLLSTAMLFGMLIGGEAITEVNAQDTVSAKFEKYKFDIIECNTGDRMGVGQPDDSRNVLRKKYEPGVHAVWSLKKDESNPKKWNLVHNETQMYLDVQNTTGNVHLAEERKGDIEQIFTLEFLSNKAAEKLLSPKVFQNAVSSQGQHFVRIVESTRNERLTVDRSGNIVRWAKRDGSDQVFSFRIPSF